MSPRTPCLAGIQSYSLLWVWVPSGQDFPAQEDSNSIAPAFLFVNSKRRFPCSAPGVAMHITFHLSFLELPSAKGGEVGEGQRSKEEAEGQGRGHLNRVSTPIGHPNLLIPKINSRDPNAFLC